MLDSSAGKEFAEWFTFSSKSDPPGAFGVYAFSGNEAVCEPYEFEIELVSRSANVDITALTGQQALVSITDRSSGTPGQSNEKCRQTLEKIHSQAYCAMRMAILPKARAVGKQNSKFKRIFRPD